MSVIARVGLDLSLRSPGVCSVMNGRIKFFYWPQRVTYKTSEVITVVSPMITLVRFAPLPEERHPRMCRIVDDIVDVLTNSNPQLVLDASSVRIENYAFGVANSSSLTVLAELGGAVKTALCRLGIKWTETSPQAVKMQLTGNGHADKLTMIDEWERRFGINLAPMLECKRHLSPYNDLVDAYALTLDPRTLQSKMSRPPKQRKRQKLI
jgi:Holliday junction resolvasome RuvABC endonuclease subunit